jgi:NAD(P)-dependent dehydrogenase (short-subunit alcohol dehydrogenase family)
MVRRYTMRLEGKVAFISGAATGVRGELMGFGGASAWLFVREGAKVVLGDINEEDGARTAAQIHEWGGEALFVRLDVTSEQDWIDAIRTTVNKYGKLDIMVNNAGTGARKTVEETTEDIWDGQMAVHAKGVFLGTKHAIPEMRKIGGGSIVNVSSIMGLVGSPTSPAYSAAKGAIRIFTKAAAIKYAGENIRINSVHPGYATTPLTQRSFSEPETAARLLATVPAGRYGTADDIAYGILFLASDESSYMTGSELVIDGGMTAR